MKGRAGMEGTLHRLIVGSSESMRELDDASVHLAVTSPPYFNAPFDYEGLFDDYDRFLGMMSAVASESFRVLADGRIFVLNIDDMLVKGEKFPIVADAIKIFQHAGFRYRDHIIWKKPDGYVRISRRSGVTLQNPYPMYFYPDNLLESIVIFQKGRFDYKSVPRDVREKSKIDIPEFQKNRWYMTLWEMVNILPNSTLEKDIAAFPEELPYRAIKLFSHVGETVLDPFAGSGTTMKVARSLGRSSVGFEVKRELLPVISEKLALDESGIKATRGDRFEVVERRPPARARSQK